MSEIARETLAIPVTGSAGSGAGEASVNTSNGLIVGIYIPSGQHANTDIVFYDTNDADTPLFTLTNFNTQGWFCPSMPIRSEGGTAVSGGTVPIGVVDGIRAVVTGGIATGTITLKFMIQRADR